MLGIFLERKHKMEKTCINVTHHIFTSLFIFKWSHNKISFCTSCIGFGINRFYPVSFTISRAYGIRCNNFMGMNPLLINRNIFLFYITNAFILIKFYIMSWWFIRYRISFKICCNPNGFLPLIKSLKLFFFFFFYFP